MIYAGSRAEGVSTNPVAIAAPTGNPERPILLDMSTAAVALGKIMAARDEAVQPPQQIIAGHHADRHLATETHPLGELGNRRRARAGIHATRVGRDLDAAFDDGGKDPLHLRDEIGGVAARRIARLLFLKDGHRDFSEIIHHEVVDRPAPYLPVRRLQPVSPKPLSASHSYRRRSSRH